MAFFIAGPVHGNVSYVRLNEENVAANLVRREELTARARINVTRNWSVGGAWRLDLEGNRTISQDFTVRYVDNCASLGVTVQRNRTQAANLEPDTAVLLTFQLKSLIE
jgi:LPS-assembly protein